MLYGIVFDCVIFFPYAATVGCVRAKASVYPHISDDVIIHVAVKGVIFDFIGFGGTKNMIILCESLQDLFKFIAIYHTQMTHVNFMKKVLWDGIKLYAIFGLTRLFSWVSGRF